jgi:hypothetical protein
MNTDTLHDFGKDLDWNESFYFSFYDKANDVLSFMRIGLKPNRKMKELFCFFIMPDGVLVGNKEQVYYDSPALATRGLAFQNLDPEKRWRLLFAGNLMKASGSAKVLVNAHFDLLFETLNPVFNYRECVSGEKERVSRTVASEHLEQFGKITGHLFMGGKEYRIYGLGERDHSWGVREWNAPKMWAWLNCQFNENCALNVTKLVMDNIEIDAGYFFDGAANRPLVKAIIDTSWGKDGSPDSLRMLLTDKLGKEYAIEAEVLKKAALPFQGPDGKALSILHETLGRYRMGDLKGYGIVEYLIRKD